MKRKAIAILLLVVILVGSFTAFSYGAGKKTGLYKDNGQWKYFENGTFKKATGLVQRPDNQTWHYVEKGIYKKVTGLVQCVQPGSSKGKWYYVVNGDLDSTATGLVQCVQPGSSKGKWYYVSKGKMSTTATGLVQCIQPGGSKGKWYYVRDGKQKNATGFTKCIQPGSSYGKKYYVEFGKKSSYTGLIYENGKNYYVKNGKWMNTFNGRIKMNGSTYSVKNGIATYDEYHNMAYPQNRLDYGMHCYVKGSKVKLRYGPSESYGIIMTLPNGGALVEKGYNNNNYDWIYCEYDGEYGWVKTSGVEFVGGMAKPAIYLYPTEETDVDVSVNLKTGRLTTTIPEYNAGWHVTAYPDGKIVDKKEGSVYPYLFWESDGKIDPDWSEGFCVRGEDTEKFLLGILPQLGLIENEYNEFIEFWLPYMEKNEYNLISFQAETYTDLAELDITPAPDSVLRIFMAYKAVDESVKIKAPTIETFERKGFTVVEWGGTEVL